MLTGSSPQGIPRLLAEIERDLRDLETLAAEMRDAKQRFQDREPDSYDLRAVAGILHDFYTGVEKIFVKVEEEINGGLPAGDDWHKRLLSDMSLEIPEVRPPMITESLGLQLEEYLRFRHLARHTYGFRLVHRRMAHLLDGFEDVYAEFRSACRQFIEFISSLTKG